MRQLVRNTGEVFDALSERDGQLAGAHHQLQPRLRDDRARATRSCRRRSRRCRRSRRSPQTTLKRLSQFSANANPVVTDLRPAAKQLSPTLQQLSAIAPDLKALFRSTRPAGRRPPRRACRRRREFLDQLHPLLANFDGAAGAAQPDPRRRRPVQERADRVLRQLDGRDAGDDALAGARRARALPAHVQPAEPRDARAVSASG